MAIYQIMYWHDIPSQVKVKDKTGTVKKMLPDRFMQAIDSAAMAAGKTDSEAYMTGWKWSKREERPGSADEIAESLAAELDAAFPKERLRAMIMAHARKNNG